MQQGQRARSNTFLALLRVSRITALTLYYLIRHTRAVWGLGKADRRRVTGQHFQNWAQGVGEKLGIRVEVAGPIPAGGVLLAPNHQTYLDIIVLASVVPVVFVAKQEIDQWPVFGFLLRQADQLLIKRTRSKQLVKCLAAVEERLQNGHSVCVFLEGTTSDGEGVRSFLSPLLKPAVDVGAPVVPVSIRWSSDDSQVLVADDIAYWGDHSFLPHAWRLLGLRGLRSEIHFGTGVSAAGCDRRDLADEVHRRVVDLYGERG